MLEQRTDIEHAVDRHDAAIIEEATTIARLRCEVALIIEALEKLELYRFDGLEHHAHREAARDRYLEIVEQLKASHTHKMPEL
jgi:hypothetical protein